MAIAAATSTRRLVALVVVCLLVIVPVLWVAWSLSAASVLAGAVRDQSETLASLQARLAALSAATGDAANLASVYLPGETPATAGASLQRIVANTVEGAGGRLAESEISRSDSPEEEPGVVNLRVSFETDIVGLQRIIFELETGAPILMLQSISVEGGGDPEAADSGNPSLSVVLLVRGYREA
jgi:hypothetical protein